MYFLRKVTFLLGTIIFIAIFCLLCSASVIDQPIYNTVNSQQEPSDIPAIIIKTESDDNSVPGESSETIVNSEPVETSDPQKDPDGYSRLKDYIFSFKGETKNIDTKKLEKLENIIKTQTKNVSFYYENLETGIVITYYPDKIYFSASVIKAPYVVSILKKGIDLSEVITTSSVVGDNPVDTEMTVDQLIRHTIVYSDNNSYAELTKRYGRTVFNNYSEGLGSYCRIKSGNYGYMTAYEAAVYFKDIYKFASEDKKGSYLTNYMKKPDYNQQIGKDLCKLFPVAQKYGASYKYSVFHNAAIVYAKSPYILTIFTDIYPSEPDTAVFRDIASVVNEINMDIIEQQAVAVNATESTAG